MWSFVVDHFSNVVDHFSHVVDQMKSKKSMFSNDGSVRLGNA